ncbi:MAG TPA: hypothetical protein VG455_04300 [Acidimicrobiales bacterium]|nr:hypothetical protein [Acidimicrobiales bacterium]
MVIDSAAHDTAMLGTAYHSSRSPSGALFRPGRELGTPLGGLDAQGRRFPRLKVHAAVCAQTDLPVAWRVETGGSHESNYAAPLLDVAQSHGFAAETTALGEASAGSVD